MTELLSDKTKAAHKDLFDKYAESLNKTSILLDTVDTSKANSNASDYRRLKVDEIYNMNAAFLHSLYFENISDLESMITRDSYTYMRLQRDFGTFDDWQKDFVACAMSNRNGWAITVYNIFLKRYINILVDGHSTHIPINSIPVVVLDCWEHAYYRDYLNNKKEYVYAMMQEFDWNVIEERVRQIERMINAGTDNEAL